MTNQKVYGVLRVYNTVRVGNAATALEAGSAVLSTEATRAVIRHYPGALIAITNHHVVGEQRSVRLNFYFNQVSFPATVLKVFPQYDIAFLHISINTPEFKLANICENGEQRQIELINGSSCKNPTFMAEIAKVIAVGYPLGTSHQTLSKGNITALGTMGESDDVALLHDCVINPGNSGGALLYKGQLIGINTAILSPSKFNTVSIARPFASILPLLKYLAPDKAHDELSGEAYRQLTNMYHVYAEPDVLMKNFEAHKCGGVKANDVAVTFADWFNKYCLDKPESHALLQQVLEHLVENPEKIHALREQGWNMCADCTPNCQIHESIVNPDRVVFEEHFKISPTDPICDKLNEKFGHQGVIITESAERENISDGELLVGINGRKLDNFGFFVDNGLPYFTAFKRNPDTPVRLNIATEDKKIKIVEYVYQRMKKLPRVHAPQMTPFTAPEVINIAGVYVTQMNADIAKAKFPQYLKPPLNNSVVGVVVQIDADSAAWQSLKIQPGSLLTKVNGKALGGNSIMENLKDAKFLTFENNNKSIIKLV